MSALIDKPLAELTPDERRDLANQGRIQSARRTLASIAREKQDTTLAEYLKLDLTQSASHDLDDENS
jgi:hypothetical protein